MKTIVFRLFFYNRVIDFYLPKSIDTVVSNSGSTSDSESVNGVRYFTVVI